MGIENPLELRQNPILTSVERASLLSERYEIPKQDIILIALNLSGIKAEIPQKRVRFRLTPDKTSKDFYFALCVNTAETQFRLAGSEISLSGEKIGEVHQLENDTCNDNYFRRNDTELTLNTNARSLCTGCAICRTYSLEAEDKERLLNRDFLERRIREIMSKRGEVDCSNLYRISICTGCFGSERNAVEHLLDLNDVLKRLNFKGTLRYIGSEVSSEQSLDRIASNVSKFALSFTTEVFTRRDKLLRLNKARVSIDIVKKVLYGAVNRGFEANILYVLGLDPLDSFVDGFKQLSPLMNHFPIVNLFQIYSPEQVLLRDKEANGIEYYLKARKALEDIYKNSVHRPESWENYRPLWYLSFGKEEKNDIRI